MLNFLRILSATLFIFMIGYLYISYKDRPICIKWVASAFVDPKTYDKLAKELPENYCK